MTDHPAFPLPERGSCTGCGACASGCPKGAIHMLPDREGFLYPTVTDACIQCGHCAAPYETAGPAREKVFPAAGPPAGHTGAGPAAAWPQRERPAPRSRRGDCPGSAGTHWQGCSCLFLCTRGFLLHKSWVWPPRGGSLQYMCPSPGGKRGIPFYRKMWYGIENASPAYGEPKGVRR